MYAYQNALTPISNPNFLKKRTTALHSTHWLINCKISPAPHDFFTLDTLLGGITNNLNLSLV